MGNLDLSTIIYRVITLLVAFTIHEFSHAWVATQLGDDTPRLEGRLSLNPLRHLDPWGCLMLIIVGFGWAKPVHVNPYAVTRKNKAGMMLVAAAGPFSNLLLAILGAILLRMRWIPLPAYFLRLFIWTNLSLLVFNLIPLSPLDGEKVLGYFIPDSGKQTWAQIQRYGQQILMMVFFVLPYLGMPFAQNLIVNITFSLYRILV